jgi:N-acetylglucosamine kinase-like BadF-type ATPase
VLELVVAMLLVVGTTGFIVVGLAGALPDERKVKREIAVRRVQPISSIIDGAPVAIRGEVVPAREGVTQAPLTGRDCVWWMVIEGRRTKKTGGYPFNLRDASGATRVVPIDARIAVPAVHQEADGGAVEYAILPGAIVTIVGWCTFEPDPDAVADVTGYRKELPTRPVVSGTRRQRLLIG